MIILVLAAVFVYWFSKNNPCCDNNNIVTSDKQTNYAYLLEFTFDKDHISSVKYPNTFSPNQSLFEITQQISVQENWDFGFEDYGDMGILVTQISDKINGQDKKYWQFFVNDQQPLISAEKYYPKFDIRFIFISHYEIF